MVYSAFGIRFVIRVRDAEPRRYLHNYLPYGSQRLRETRAEDLVSFALRRSPDGERWRVWKERSRICETESLRFALERLHEALLYYVSSQAFSFTFVHAGAVVWKRRALILPGRTFSGKSTLVRRLVEAGATYYSDDIAVIDSLCQVHPYARTLRFRDEGTFCQRLLPLSQIANGECSLPVAPARVRMVAFTVFDKERSWECRRLSPGGLAMEGLRHTLSVRSSPSGKLQAWAALGESALGFCWRRNEATEAACKLLRALESGCMPE